MFRKRIVYYIQSNFKTCSDVPIPWSKKKEYKYHYFEKKKKICYLLLKKCVAAYLN